MDWRRWLRQIWEWAGFTRPLNVLPDIKETAVPPPPSSSKAETPSLARSTTAFSLRLVNAGPDRESVIHLLQEMSGLSLRQIRTLVDSAPAQVLGQIDAHTGRAIQKRLESLGAVCELVGGRPDAGAPPSTLPDTGPQPTHPDNTFFLFGDYSVTLKTAGPRPSQVVRILRDLLNGRTLTEVEHMVANTPQQIVRQVPLETAETIQIRLERAGAAVEIVGPKRHD